jgi:hypothetical protein
VPVRLDDAVAQRTELDRSGLREILVSPRFAPTYDLLGPASNLPKYSHPPPIWGPSAGQFRENP